MKKHQCIYTCKISRTRIKSKLQTVINNLIPLPCTFWSCEGPNKPFEHMKTCSKCGAIKELRQLKKEL